MTDYDLSRYLSVRGAGGATLATDDTLAFLYDATGVSQVWTLDEPGAWPTQRTFYDEPVSFVTASPTRPEFVFGMDDGGNERLQLHRLDPDGTITDLTARPDAKHRWGGWSHDGDRFAFASNRRDEAVFDVYVQERDERGDAAEMVYEGDGWLSLGGWDPADERLIVTQSHSSFDQDVYVLDVDSGALTHLTPQDDTRFYATQWGPDGDSLYLVTDDGSDTLYLARMDPETGALSVVREGGDWEIDGVAVDHDSALLVYSRNVDGYTELTLTERTDPTTLRDLPLGDLPGAVAGGVAFGPDGDRLALTASGRTETTDVHVVDVATLREADVGADQPPGAAERWTRASTAGIPPETFVDPELVHYETFDGREIPAFLSVPPGADPGETPAIIDVHGGPASQRRPGFSGLFQYFLSAGYALLEPNVRGSSGYGRAYTELDDVEKRPDSVKDLKAAREWLGDHDLVDPNRIAVKGGSYGGFMVLAGMTRYPDLWAAGVDVVGIANFVTFLENTGDWRRSLREKEYGSLEADRDLLEELSPIHDADNIQAPLFVIHGANDPRVPLGEAEQIVEAAREKDVPVELLVFEDEGHGLSKLDNQVTAYEQVVAFLDDHV
ncbi:prolyl oligopeptidase family serine peptidase [Halobacteriales archaeon Cl-PHB]